MKNVWKTFALMTVMAATVSTAQTEDYQCLAKANPERGFTVDMQVVVEKARMGGKIGLNVQGVERLSGTVNLVETLVRANPDDTNAFDSIMRLIGEKDVSGLASSQYGRLTHIIAIGGMLDDAQEIYVYRLFAGTAQVGGTVLVAGFGTACK